MVLAEVALFGRRTAAREDVLIVGQVPTSSQRMSLQRGAESAKLPRRQARGEQPSALECADLCVVTNSEGREGGKENAPIQPHSRPSIGVAGRQRPIVVLHHGRTLSAAPPCPTVKAIGNPAVTRTLRAMAAARELWGSIALSPLLDLL